MAVLLIIFYVPLTYIFLGTLPLFWAVISVYMFYAVRGYATPVLKDLVNQNCDSSVRATVLSIRNLVIRFGFALLGPMIGMVSVASSLSLAFITAGVILLANSMWTAHRLFRYHPEFFSQPR